MNKPSVQVPELQGFNRLKQCRYGLMLYNPNDVVLGRSLDLYGEFSEGEAVLFLKAVKPGQLVLDIGANIGAHTLVFSKAVGPQGLVFAFEPQRLSFQTLCANMALNGITNAACYYKAVGEDIRNIRVPYLDPYAELNFGGLSLKDQQTGEPVEQISIDCLNLNECHFMKIDVEGMECQVLRGAKETIGRHRPILYVENDREEQSEELIRLIASMKYRLYWHRMLVFNPDNFNANPTNVFSDMVSINMMCVPEESPLDMSLMTPVEIP